MNSKTNSFQYTSEAYNAYKKKRYSEAAILLEKASEFQRHDPYIYFLLAVSYLFSDRFGRADTAMNMLKRTDPEYMPGLELDAYVRLKSVNTLEEALAIYLDLIANYPRYSSFTKYLNIIRKSASFSEFQKRAKLSDFVHVPAPSKKKSSGLKGDEEVSRKKNSLSKKLIPLVLIIGLSLAGGFFIYSRFLKQDDSMKSPVKDDRSFEMVRLGGSGYDLIRKINRKKVPEFYYSSADVKMDFDRAGRLIKAGRYNDALFILNKINNSNVSFRVQEKVEFLIKFITDTEERNFVPVSIDAVMKKAYLYRGYAVEWKGRITNLRKKKKSCTFTLLVDYVKKDTFSGTAEVFCDEADPGADNGSSVSVKGLFIKSIGDDSRIHLVAREVNPVTSQE